MRGLDTVLVLCPNVVLLISISLTLSRLIGSVWPAENTGWFTTLKACAWNVNFRRSVMLKSFPAEASQSKYAGPLKAFNCRLPTSPGCGLQKPPGTAGVQPL